METIQDQIPIEGIRLRGLCPEPYYLCEGVEAGLETLTEHFPPSIDDGLFPAEQLFYARFVVPEYASEFGGFWCGECIKQLGVSKGRSLAAYQSEGSI